MALTILKYSLFVAATARKLVTIPLIRRLKGSVRRKWPFAIKTKDCFRLFMPGSCCHHGTDRESTSQHIRKSVWLSLVDPISEAKENRDAISGILTIYFCSQNSYYRMWVSTVISYGHCSCVHSTVYLCDIIVIEISCGHMNPLSVTDKILSRALREPNYISLLMCDIYDKI